MNIKPFELTDLGAFIPNEHSNPDEVFPLLLDARYEVRTLWGEDGLVQAIICFRNYWSRCWACFVLIAKNFDTLNYYNLRELMHSYMVEREAIRLETTSRSIPKLRKWHRWMGFTLEGTKRKMMFNQDYDCWAIVREGA